MCGLQDLHPARAAPPMQAHRPVATRQVTADATPARRVPMADRVHDALRASTRAFLVLHRARAVPLGLLRTRAAATATVNLVSEDPAAGHA